MPIVLNGKPIKARANPHRDGKHKLLDAHGIEKRQALDPFPPIDVFRNDTVEHRISVGCELKGWVEQKMGELATTVDEADWLRRQLEDGAHADHPDRPEAVVRCKKLEDDIVDLATDIAFLEAHADRIWQSLDPADREPLAAAWVADVNDDRIILNAWTRIAQVGFRWPKNYGVYRTWFASLSRPLIDDMNERGLKDGIPLGEQKDPFEDKEQDND